MLNFLKKFFGKKEIEVIKLELKDLKHFFDEKSEKITKELDLKIKETKGKIDNEIGKTRENLDILKKSELRNEKIPLKARQFMDGNRESYIKSVRGLINRISIEEDYEKIGGFCEDFKERLAEFTKSSIKAYRILQEFFANEARDIALNIKNIDLLIKELRLTLKKEKISEIKQLGNEISSIEKKENEKLNLKNRLNELEDEKKRNIDSKKHLEELYKRLKQGDEYKELLILNELNKKSLNNLGELKNNVFHSFSIINTSLKKYFRITVKDVVLLKKYIEYPVLSLVNDDELKILEFLEGTKKNKLNKTIELKERKKNKTLEEIAKLDKKFFVDFKKKYQEIQEKLEDLEKRTKGNKSNEKLENINQKLEDNDKDFKKIESSISHLKSEIEKIDFDKIKKRFEKEIKDVFDEKVSIS